MFNVEKVTEEDKRGWLTFAVCLSALTNYYFMVQQVIFVVLYYFVKNGFEERHYMLYQLFDDFEDIIKKSLKNLNK